MMYQRTNNGETFLARTANHSTKGSRRGYLLGWHKGFHESMSGNHEDDIKRLQRIRDEIEPLLYTEKGDGLANVKRRVRVMAKRALKEIEDGADIEQMPEKKRLAISFWLAGQQIFKIKHRVNAGRGGPKKKHPVTHTIPWFFTLIAEEMLPAEDFERIMQEAKQRQSEFAKS